VRYRLSGAVLGGQPDRVGAILIGAKLTRARFAKLYEGDPNEAANLTRASLFDANLTGQTSAQPTSATHTSAELISATSTTTCQQDGPTVFNPA
jgi:uncharacterized protein YjbI with pentapeptide repeats